MHETILDRILDAKRTRVAAIERECDSSALKQLAEHARATAGKFQLTAALSEKNRPNIIAEIKRASPSRGALRLDADVEEIARSYEESGAAAISVLTEEDYFSGSLVDLQAVRAVCRIPLLRKDFIVSEFQIYESAAYGADAVLLIVAALRLGELAAMLDIAQNELHMDAIVEVHTEEELRKAHDAGATLIGVNNRNLKTFETSLEVSRRLIKKRRPGSLYISESGIDQPEQIAELRSIGFDGFLIGEALMRADERASALKSLLAADAERRAA